MLSMSLALSLMMWPHLVSSTELDDVIDVNQDVSVERIWETEWKPRKGVATKLAI